MFVYVLQCVGTWYYVAAVAVVAAAAAAAAVAAVLLIFCYAYCLWYCVRVQQYR